MDINNPNISASPCLGRPLTTANGCLITSHTITLLCNKIPIGYIGMPHIHPLKLPLPVGPLSLPSISLILGPSQPTIPNGIQI